MSTYQGRGGGTSLGDLEDIIIDGLTMDEAKRFEDALIGVLFPLGKDFSRVDMRMRLLMLTDDIIGLRRIAYLDGQPSIDRVAELIRRDLDSDNKPTEEEWIAAKDGAWTASRAAKVASSANAARAAYWAAAGAGAIWCGTVDAAAAKAIETRSATSMVSPASDAIWRRIAELFLVELAAAPMALDLHRVEIRHSAD